MENVEKSIVIHPSIGQGESLANLERSRLENLDGLKDVQHIAVVRIYRMKPAIINASYEDRYHVIQVIDDRRAPTFDEREIDRVNLYHPDDVREILGCSDDESQIISVGRYEKCDLRPTLNKKKNIEDMCVSRNHCAVSLNPDTNHIQITDIGTFQNGSTHGTFVNGEKIFRTTSPWNEGDRVSIGRVILNEPLTRRIGLAYELTDYGRSRGVNQEVPQECSYVSGFSGLE